jgi:hypothetical protein
MPGFTPVNVVRKRSSQSTSTQGNSVPVTPPKRSPSTEIRRPSPSPRLGTDVAGGTVETSAGAVNSFSVQSYTVAHHGNPYMFPQQRSRANPPLDLTSVGRRSDTNHDQIRTDRPFNLECVPTFRPSEIQFSDPLEYIASISTIGKKYGAVKIIPPESWEAPFCLDTEMFWFRTRRQCLNPRDGGRKAQAEFVDGLYSYHKINGTPINKVPSIDKRPLDLYHLRQCVTLRGGFTEVCKKKLWAQIGRELGYSGKIMTSLSTSLKSAYQKLIFPYDQYLETNGTAQPTAPTDEEKLEEDHESEHKRAPPEQPPSSPPSKKIKLEDEETTEDEPRGPMYPRVSNSEMAYYRLKQYTGIPSIPEDSTIPPFDTWHGGLDVIEDKIDLREAPSYNLRQFQQKAEQFRTSYFTSLPSPIESPTENDIEREFWKVVNDPTAVVEVEYGADIHSSVQSSAFPKIERDISSPGVYDPWNLNVIPLHERSFFRFVSEPIPFLVQPWLHVGMVFSTQSWHFEDFYAYSLTYHHLGDTKTWYCVPEKDNHKLKNLLIEVVGPELTDSKPSALLESDYMLSPETLQQNGIECYTLDQKPGELVVTFPKVYYAQINHGFNFTESSNVLPFFDWLDYGKECLELYRKCRKEPPFSIQRLLMNIASKDTGISNAKMYVTFTPSLSRFFYKIFCMLTKKKIGSVR